MDSGQRPRKHILVVDAEIASRQGLTSYLTQRHVGVTAVEDTQLARGLIDRQHFDAVLLDADVDGEEGMRLAAQLGARGLPPLIILSGRTDESDCVVGLELGADDYLCKPVGMGELFARLRALWRRMERASIPGRTVAHVGRWRVNLVELELTSDDGMVTALTGGESALLSAFLHHPMHVLTRAELLRLTDHDEAGVFDRTIDVLVARLRRKLERDSPREVIIQTVRGRGYRLTAPVSWEAPGD